MKSQTYFGTDRVSLFFFKIFFCIFYSSYMSFKDKIDFRYGLIVRKTYFVTDLVLSVILIAFFLHNFSCSANFSICLSFVKSKDFLYKF